MPAKTVKTIKHYIRLQGFDLEEGKISFSLMSKLSDHLIRLSESSLLSFVEGNSAIKRGKQASWLTKSLDFNLSGIKEGSTILEIEAPMLKDTLPSIQVPIFSDQPVEDIAKNSALGLGMLAFNQALGGKLDSSLLDKQLLREMRDFGKFLTKKGSCIEFSSGKKVKPLKLRKENIEKIKSIEEKTPASIKTKVIGVLDMLKHSNNQLELIIDGTKRIRAILTDKVKISELTSYFGSEITVTGVAHYNPMGQVITFEISGFSKSDKKGKYFQQLPKPLFELTDIKRIVEEQEYKGYHPDKVKRITEQLEVEDSLEDLLEIIK